MTVVGELDFEAALSELDHIVEALERGGPDLKTALTSYGRGVDLLGRCQTILDGAERSVALLSGVDDAGQPITSPFDASATVGTAAGPVAPPAPTPRESISDAPF